jgi:nitrate reductase NapE component
MKMIRQMLVRRVSSILGLFVIFCSCVVSNRDVDDIRRTRDSLGNDAAAPVVVVVPTLRSGGSSLSVNPNFVVDDNNDGEGVSSSWRPHWKWPDWHHHDDPKNDTKKDSCEEQSNCTSCLLHSSFCQWCDKDTRCHSSLSLSRCWTSGKCYTNEKCHRDEPEPVRHLDQRDIPSIAYWIIFATASFVLFCLTLGFVSIGSLNSAYRDVVKTNPQQQQEQQDSDDIDDCSPMDQHYHAWTQAHQDQKNKRAATANETPPTEEQLTQPLLLEQDQQEQQEQTTEHTIESQNHNEEDTLPITNATIIDRNNNNNNRNNSNNNDNRRSSCSTKTRSRYMSCMFGTCTLFYVVAIACTVGTTFFVIYMFPQVPQLNICSDEVAWNSIIQGLESMQFEASFGILMSVYNPNRFGVLVKDFEGQFHHAGNYLGKYQIATTTFAPMSITDVTMTCTFSPDKWEAMKIAAQYYERNLVLQVNAQGTIQLPNRTPIWPVHLGDMTINVTDFSMDDRHLCACPKWQDTKKKDKKKEHPDFISAMETPIMIE